MRTLFHDAALHPSHVLDGAVVVGDGPFSASLSVGPEPVDPALATQWVVDPDCGAVATFLGIPRADSVAAGTILALDYEAYEAGARSEMSRIASEARARWDIRKLWIAHRSGSVAVGEVALMVALSSPHRPAAFAALEWIVAEVKARVPVWKHETVATEALLDVGESCGGDRGAARAEGVA